MSLSTPLRLTPTAAELIAGKVLPAFAASPPMSLKGQLIVATSSLFVVGSFIWLPLSVYWLYRRSRSSRRVRLIIAGVLIFLILVPVSQWNAMRDWKFWHRWTEYFSPKLIIDDGLTLTQAVTATMGSTESATLAIKGAIASHATEVAVAQEPHIVCLMPHGIYPFGQGIAMVSRLNTFFRNLRPIAASGVMKFPGFRHLLGWLGTVEASKKGIERGFKDKVNLMLVPGGVAEMFKGNDRDEVVLLKGRQGFISLALQHGVPILPVFMFGNSQLLKLVPGSSYLEYISRIIRVSLLLFYGRFGLPIPFRRPLLYAVGQPITSGLGPIAKPSPEQVAALHQAFIASVTHLFDKYKGIYGWGNKTLRVV